eukprot:gb/GECG01009751.1/.p1 GENE.gb/GECG01009751.1/~~gb/GECG01009751.1/.p1  ORF type:complete len:365 (+),score=20.41 gb/GECG01009751.1/:1-1095(+)
MRTFAYALALCAATCCVQAEESEEHYFPADATALGNECSWIKECTLSPPSGCEQYRFHERPCACLTPAAKCMYEHWKRFSTSQREDMYNRCGRTQFPFGVHMHYLHQKNCEFAAMAQKELDEQRELQSYSYSCGWTLADGFHNQKRETYEHEHICLRAPGWPKHTSLNYTELVIQKGGAQQVSMYLSVSEHAGIDYHFYSGDMSASKSGKLEPGHSDSVCTNALYPKFFPGVLNTGIQYMQPRATDDVEGIKWVIYFKNRNWIHNAHVQMSFGPECFNGMDSKNDYSLCTNKTVNWSLVDGSTSTFYAINGCEMHCEDTSSTTPCCISTGKPPSYRTGCGTNCANCKNGCSSNIRNYHRGSRPV